MLKLIENTPVERWKVEDKLCFVKREDLCTPAPGPPFSKMRGVYKHMQSLKVQGISRVGYVETDISMAGIAVSACAKELGMKCYIFYPSHKEVSPDSLLLKHMEKWNEYGAELVPIKPGRAKVNFNICKRDFPNVYILPLGLPLRETVDETAKEFRRTPGVWTSVVVAVGSGTICAGLLSGMSSGTLIGVMCRTGDAQTKNHRIWARSGKNPMLSSKLRLTLIDPGYEYMDQVAVDCPFPTHPYYDAKAVKFVIDHIEELEAPVLLWNIGREI